MLYTNGDVPDTMVSVVLGSGYDSKGRYWEHRLTPATNVRWQAAVQYAVNKWGKRMRIRDGANGYRNRAWQVIARADACASGNCNGASVVGYSSHGGNWNRRDCLAIDVNPNGLTWAQVWEACRAAGFECGLITQEISGIPGGEPWHIIDFNAFGPVPAGAGAIPFPEEEEEPMFTIYRSGGAVLIVGNGSIMELGPGLTTKTGVDGAETLASFVSAGAKVVDLDRRQFDVVRVHAIATSPAPAQISPDIIRGAIKAEFAAASIDAAVDDLTIDAIADRVADEQDRRARERLNG